MDIKTLFEAVVTGIELVAVMIVAVGLIWEFIIGARDLRKRKSAIEVYKNVRRNIGRVLLLGLEVLIAADILRTVTIDLTMSSVATLGLLVLVRTFLSWSIELETDGHWPWQTRASRQASH
jgi:uncharacterized membrane protein